MSPELLSYLYALGSNVSFAWATVAYAHYGQKLSPLWINCFKASLAFICFLVAYFTLASHATITPHAFAYLFLSGLIALNLGDWLLMRAFTKLGASRALMLFGFQPMIYAVTAYLLFGQIVAPLKWFAILFLIASLVVVSFENYKRTKTIPLRELGIGFAAISLDACGVLLTRAGFELTSGLTALEANFYRTIGTIAGFVVISFFLPIRLIEGLKTLRPPTQLLLTLAGISGTFVSLCFYLEAIRIGKLAAISAVAITGPLFAGMIECALQRKWPSPYLIGSFLLFAAGFLALIR